MENEKEMLLSFEATENKKNEYKENEDTVTENIVTENTVTESLSAEQPFIVCDSLVKIYKTTEVEVMALQGLEIEIKKGEYLAIIGKSGSGKSTLMNIIGGLEKPSAGKILVDGKNLADYSEKEMVHYRSQMVGFVWQKSSRNLYQYLTALGNVEAAMCFSKRSKKEKRERALELLTLAGIDHKKDSLPSQMSGGEQQRVAIAVALANGPQILLADEPTGAVDSKTASMIQDLFRMVNQKLGITVIIVTHDMKMAENTDRVVMISDGKISTEKNMKEAYHQGMSKNMQFTDEHVKEYSVMDKARRVQLDEKLLNEAGIDGNKVRLYVEDGRLIIEGENK